LGDVAGDAAEVGAVGGGAVEEEEVGLRGRGEAASEDLEQGGLAGAAGANDGEQLAGARAAGDVPEHMADAVVVVLVVLDMDVVV
jgi:hypothetical protein